MKRIICVITAFLLPVTAYASVSDVKLNLSDNSIAVTGKTAYELAGKEVKLIITNPGYTIDDLQSEDIEKALYHAGQTETDRFGNYSFNIKVNDSAESGYYSIYVQDDDKDEPELYTKFYADEDYKKMVINNLNNSSENDMEMMLEAVIEPLSINDTVIKGVGIDKTAELIYDYKSKNRLSDSDFEQTAKLIEGLAVVAAYNNNMKELCFKDGEFLNADVLNFTEADKNNSSFYEIYSTLLNDDAKKKVREGLLGNSFKSINELFDKFDELIIINGISGSMYEGTGHISKLLTKANGDRLNVSFEPYINIKNAIALKNIETDLMKEKYSNIKAVEARVRELAEKYKPSENGNGGGNGGGKSPSSSSGNYAMEGVVASNNIEKNGEAKLFDDIENYSWAKEAIEYLFENKIISGVGNNKFAPENEITREQYVVMIVKALKLDINEYASKFDDVKADDYFAKYVSAAESAGIIKGVDENHFGVGMKITRQDICTIIHRAFFAGEEAQINADFTDRNQIEEYAVKAVDLLTEKKILNGFEDGSFAPNAMCTRAQAAKIIYGTLMQKAD